MSGTLFFPRLFSTTLSLSPLYGLNLNLRSYSSWTPDSRKNHRPRNRSLQITVLKINYPNFVRSSLRYLNDTLTLYQCHHIDTLYTLQQSPVTPNSPSNTYRKGHSLVVVLRQHIPSTDLIVVISWSPPLPPSFAMTHGPLIREEHYPLSIWM